jgi:hypothetical protein
MVVGLKQVIGGRRRVDSASDLEQAVALRGDHFFQQDLGGVSHE